MDFHTQVSGAGRIAADAVLLLICGEQLQDGIDEPVAAAVKAAVKAGDLELKAGKTAYLHRVDGVASARLAVAAVGAPSARAVRSAASAGLGLLKGSGVAHVAVQIAGAGALQAEHVQALCAAAGDAAYQYRHTKPSAPSAPALKRLTVLAANPAEARSASAELKRGAAIVAGNHLARELANRPGNHCTPSHLASEARRLARQHGLKVAVYDRKGIEKIGMGSFLAVAQGSAEPPRFIVLRYDGAARREPPIVLVGKGITFDSGGISLKPGEAMDEMKFDMGGAASVLGTMRAVAELGPRVNVVGLIAATENLPGGRAVKPGDVVTSLSGQTIEILNTDAEGRLILCDALTYAERLNPAAVVDVATLTGACVIALGAVRSGLFSNDDSLAAELQAAGEAALDPCWRMPVDDEYDEALKSNFADVANVGGRPAGAVTAAMFLKRFVKKFKWAHLDIAGTAWKGGAAKGATGRPVGLLTQFVLGRALESTKGRSRVDSTPSGGGGGR